MIDTAVAPVTRPAGDDRRPVRLEVDGLKKSYGHREAVKGVTFTLTDGVTGLLGPNGAGKSTIIKCITGILDWDAGSIGVDGVDAGMRPRAARGRIGYMPERASFPPEMTVRSYLQYAARMKGVGRRDVDEAVATVLAQIDLEHMAERVIGNLSKGYRQRVGLAQAVIGSPPVLVLDEPMAGLDPLNVWDIRDVLWEYGREHLVLFSTHVLPEARVLCERIMVIAAGRLVFDGSLVEAELSGSVTRRWRVGVSGPLPERLRAAVEGVGASVVHSTSNGTSTSLVIDADSPAIVDGIARTVLAEGWSLAHLEPMTDLIDSAFREAGLR
ncbi:MAG TPA: ABC transporter ATP-binding protein [Acidimicrobiia bacterium]|nr:ABC transporter ATP-binding protein [Acidimicrobiia bacterium]